MRGTEETDETVRRNSLVEKIGVKGAYASLDPKVKVQEFNSKTEI